MFQRLDKMRKFAFASVCLFGTDNDSTISGVWVWKGHDLAFEQSPDWQVGSGYTSVQSDDRGCTSDSIYINIYVFVHQIDYESYTWQKLDPLEPATKALVNQYFSWSGTDKQGRKFNQGKIFK